MARVRGWDLGFISLKYYAGLALLVVLGLIPFISTASQLLPLISLLYLMIFGITWDIASGYTGQLNFGHAFFIAIGGYTTAILNATYGVSPLVSIPVAVITGAIAGLAIGIPVLRLRGPYLALVTFVLPPIFAQLVILRDDIFKGTFGFTSLTSLVAPPEYPSLIQVPTTAVRTIIDYYIAYILLVLFATIFFVYTRTYAGEILKAIRQNEDALEASGISAPKHKVAAFVVSAASGSLAGAFFVHSQAGAANQGSLLGPTLSLEIIIVSIIGGIGTVIGAVSGTLIYGGTRFLIGEFSFSLFAATSYDISQIVVFLVGIAVVYYEPQGFNPWLVEKASRFRHRVVSEDPEITEGESIKPKHLANYMRNRLRDRP